MSLFSTLRTLSFSDLRCIDSGYLVIATPHKNLYRCFWNFKMFFFSFLCLCVGVDGWLWRWHMRNQLLRFSLYLSCLEAACCRFSSLFRPVRCLVIVFGKSCLGWWSPCWGSGKWLLCFCLFSGLFTVCLCLLFILVTFVGYVLLIVAFLGHLLHYNYISHDNIRFSVNDSELSASVAQLDARRTWDQETRRSLVRPQPRSATFFRRDCSFRWFKKGSCQFLTKEYAQYWLTA